MQLFIDFRLVSAVLAALLLVTLFLWQPWNAKTSERTIEVNGEAKITATPDEFVFYPSYQFKNASKDAALAEVTKKSSDVVAKLKELGVSDNKIKTNSSGYDYPVYLEKDSNDVTYTLQLTVIVGNRDLAQKVQDYLITTAPTGAVSPQPAFSDGKRKELEEQARNEATKDARKKAEQMGKNLGFRVDKVKEVSDSSSGGAQPFNVARPEVANDQGSQLTLQPGQNDLHYQVTVTYFIR